MYGAGNFCVYNPARLISILAMPFYKASLEEYLDGLVPEFRRKIWNEQLADCSWRTACFEDRSDDEVS